MYNYRFHTTNKYQNHSVLRCEFCASPSCAAAAAADAVIMIISSTQAVLHGTSRSNNGIGYGGDLRDRMTKFYGVVLSMLQIAPYCCRLINIFPKIESTEYRNAKHFWAIKTLRLLVDLMQRVNFIFILLVEFIGEWN